MSDAGGDSSGGEGSPASPGKTRISIFSAQDKQRLLREEETDSEAEAVPRGDKEAPPAKGDDKLESLWRPQRRRRQRRASGGGSGGGGGGWAMKAKLRLALAVAAACLLLVLVVRVFRDPSTEDYYSELGGSPNAVMDGVQLRRLNKPFSWHEDEAEAPPGNKEEEEKPEQEDSNNNTSVVPAEKKYSTCRNSVQGKVLVADDKGCVCQRSDVLASGCCDQESKTTRKYHCEECDVDDGCCKVYEHCVSCCMHPNKKRLLMGVLDDARTRKNLLLMSVSDHYDLCLATCRTSSKSVRHENVYIDPGFKHCYGRNKRTAAKRKTELRKDEAVN